MEEISLASGSCQRARVELGWLVEVRWEMDMGELSAAGAETGPSTRS